MKGTEKREKGGRGRWRNCRKVFKMVSISPIRATGTPDCRISCTAVTASDTELN